ncbi:hypothetical protein X975_16538, partial [Stegodyphus mimosarum]
MHTHIPKNRQNSPSSQTSIFWTTPSNKANRQNFCNRFKWKTNYRNNR